MNILDAYMCTEVKSTNHGYGFKPKDKTGYYKNGTNTKL